ncbi:MAG: hypothetical protein JSV88_21410 [Candidatus Aminicenantes bacterium]|nr:MAG: hypothetical protein JSV88_21410 [Candidatus Aminicenantes bacterium]
MKIVIQKQKKSVTFLVLVSFVFFLLVSASTVSLHCKSPQNTKKSGGTIEKEVPKIKAKHKHTIWPFIVGGIAVAAVVVFLILRKSGKDKNQGPITTSGWGQKGSGQGEFLHISDICIDKDGYVYVSDGGNNRVQIFTQNGNFIKQCNISVGGMIIYNNTLYATARGSGSDSRICLFDLDGRLKNSWIVPDANKSDNQVSSLSDIAVDKNRNVYVTDYWYHRILKYTVNGVLMQTWVHGPGGPQDRFDSPVGIVIKNNEVFVSDSRNYRIIVFDLEGNPLRSWEFYDTAAAPVRMVLWGDSYLLVASRGHTEAGHMIFGTVSKYDLYGTFMGTTTRLGLSPVGIDVNFKKQKIYVTNYYEYIAVLDPF